MTKSDSDAPPHALRGVVSIVLVAALGGGCGRAPDGAAAFKTSQQAFRNVNQFTVEWTSKTELGVFRESAQFDCVAPYFHYRYVKDLSPKGVADGVTQLRGRPRAHQEEERLSVNGKSYSRNTSSWESPGLGTDDARPDWGGNGNAYDPTATCESFHRAKAVTLVPYDLIITANKIEYVGKQHADSTSCFAYRVTYPDPVSSSRLTAAPVAVGSAAFRETAQKPAQATVCLGTSDLLPRQGISGDREFKYSYGSFAKLSAP